MPNFFGKKATSKLVPNFENINFLQDFWDVFFLFHPFFLVAMILRVLLNS
jgi:hypothetical protein